MAPYNPPHYEALVEKEGLKKAKDLLVFEIDAAKGYRVPTASFARPTACASETVSGSATST